VKVREDSEIAREIEANVKAEAEEVGRQKNDVQILADEARERLKEVEPELERAKRAVETIDRKALETVRSYNKPPPVVEIVM
jgi:cellobiose-specific phosphotransferase system component IIB